MDKNSRLRDGLQRWEPGRFGAEQARAAARVRAFKTELAARMVSEKPLGARG
jgi:hypothetical protein